MTAYVVALLVPVLLAPLALWLLRCRGSRCFAHVGPGGGRTGARRTESEHVRAVVPGSRGDAR